MQHVEKKNLAFTMSLAFGKFVSSRKVRPFLYNLQVIRGFCGKNVEITPNQSQMVPKTPKFPPFALW
jgi:ribosome biogenesis protein Nip4